MDARRIGPGEFALRSRLIGRAQRGRDAGLCGSSSCRDVPNVSGCPGRRRVARNSMRGEDNRSIACLPRGRVSKREETH